MTLDAGSRTSGSGPMGHPGHSTLSHPCAKDQVDPAPCLSMALPVDRRLCLRGRHWISGVAWAFTVLFLPAGCGIEATGPVVSTGVIVSDRLQAATWLDPPPPGTLIHSLVSFHGPPEEPSRPRLDRGTWALPNRHSSDSRAGPSGEGHLVIGLPPSVRLSSGVFQGTTVRPPWVALPALRQAPTIVNRDLRLWPAFPVAVFVSRPGPEGCPGAPRDQGTIQELAKALDGINQLAGSDFFRLQEVPCAARTRRRGVRIAFRGDLGLRLGVTGVHDGGCGHLEGVGYLCHPKWIRSADVVVQETASTQAIQHEMLHALGLGHTCLVPSVMATSFPPGKLQECAEVRGHYGIDEVLQLERRMSAYDALAAQLMKELSRALGETYPPMLQWASIIWVKA